MNITTLHLSWCSHLSSSPMHVLQGEYGTLLMISTARAHHLLFLEEDVGKNGLGMRQACCCLTRWRWWSGWWLSGASDFRGHVTTGGHVTGGEAGGHVHSGVAGLSSSPGVWADPCHTDCDQSVHSTWMCTTNLRALSKNCYKNKQKVSTW